MQLVDSHCHFDLLNEEISPEEIQLFIKKASELGVKYFLNVCVSISRLEDVLRPAEKYPFVFASVGLHPNDDNENITIDELVALAQHSKIIAIGETGLDYYRSSGELEWQRQRFRNHIRAARQVKKPLIIHTRNAIDDTLAIMREESAHEVGGVMHCFTENWDAAQEAMQMGFYISFSGIVTFRNATVIQDVASKIPLNRMLVETDAPYLAPVPMRGKPNEPAYVRHTAQFIADIRNIGLDEVANQTTENFFTLFKEARRENV